SVLALAGAFGATPAEAGELSPEAVRAVVRANGHEVRACYERHAMRQKSATGKVLLDLVVRPDGGVDEVKVEAEGVPAGRFHRCVEQRARSWQFPESSGTTEVQYPFRFQHTRT
ncbi:MAG TPA: AgmX/PglI C-terminal domain-containing protein, partial [Kofleriaceae bacterium]|nr:AgmX/PglI C-terminal domain-containing protein [Kofleriaceae bacterium]